MRENPKLWTSEKAGELTKERLTPTLSRTSVLTGCIPTMQTITVKKFGLKNWSSKLQENNERKTNNIDAQFGCFQLTDT